MNIRVTVTTPWAWSVKRMAEDRAQLAFSQQLGQSHTVSLAQPHHDTDLLNELD